MRPISLGSNRRQYARVSSYTNGMPDATTNQYLAFSGSTPLIFSAERPTTYDEITTENPIQNSGVVKGTCSIPLNVSTMGRMIKSNQTTIRKVVIRLGRTIALSFLILYLGARNDKATRRWLVFFQGAFGTLASLVIPV